jgi:hypothetical protein
VGNNHDVSAKCKCPEASHSRLDALVEGAQLFPAGENNQAALAPQLDFARPPSGYFGHSEPVPFTDVVLAQGGLESNGPLVTELLGDQFCCKPSASQVRTGNFCGLQPLGREVLARPRGLFDPELG